MPKEIRNTSLLVLVVIFIGLAVWTLLPFSAPKSNDLGYISTCPFAPWSTAALAVVALVIWAIRRYLITRAD
jgi:hypothetical protein